MSRAPKRYVDQLVLGDWNAVCFECGMKFKASQLIKHWQGYWVCQKHWEPREAQDFVKPVIDNQTVPYAQPVPADVFVQLNTPNSISAIAGYAVAGIAIAGYKSPFFDPHIYTNSTEDDQ